MSKTKQLWKEIDEHEFGVNDWGSCQYGGALAIFEKLEELKEEFGNMNQALDALRIVVRNNGIANMQEVTEEFKEDIEQQLEYKREDEEEHKRLEQYLVDGTDPYPGSDDGFWSTYSEEQRRKYAEEVPQSSKQWKAKLLKLQKEGFKDVDEVFEFCKSSSWDLWSAAPRIANVVFEELDISKVREAPGRGPVFNVMAQNENYEVGLYCWLLWDAKLVKSQSSFDGFDT